MSFINVSRSDATERLMDLHDPRDFLIFTTVSSMFCFVIQLLSEPDKPDCLPAGSKCEIKFNPGRAVFVPNSFA